VNLKASLYQALADAFEHDQIEGLSDETTIGQLAGLLTEVDSHGRMKIESKEEARKRGVPSPDGADALMLALCKPPRRSSFIRFTISHEGGLPPRLDGAITPKTTCRQAVAHGKDWREV
jgi:hypothetical protein